MKRSVAALLGALLSLTLACSDGPTPQAVVCVEADDAALARAETATVTVFDGEGTRAASISHPFGTSAPVLIFPLRIPLAARGNDASRAFEVAVELFEGETRFNHRTIGGTFSATGTPAFDVDLEGVCNDIVCPADQACLAGACAPIPRTSSRELPIDTTLDLACPPTIAGSLDGFSDSAQGARNWYYGYYDRSLDVDDAYDPSDDFQLLVRNENAWRVEGMFIGGGGETTRIESNRTQGFRGAWEAGPDGWHVAIRRFVVPFDGRLSVVVTITDLDAMNDPSDDGITAFVWHEGVELVNEHLETRGPHSFPLELDVTRGARIDFGIDPGTNSAFDPTEHVVELRRID